MPEKPQDARVGKLSEETIKRLPVPDAGNWTWYFKGDVLQGAKAPSGFGVRVTAAGARSFVLDYRQKGRQHRFTIGSCDDWSALKAVRRARELRQHVDRGGDPVEESKPEVKGKTVGDVLDDFMARYARAKGKDGLEKLRGADAIESAFTRLVKPRIGKIGIYELNRRHVAETLDKIVDNSGPVMADRARAYLRKALSWYGEERDEKFNLTASIGKAARRSTGASRSRTLSDDEIRIIWPVLDDSGTFGALLQGLLLTAARRNEVAGMGRSEIGKDGIWEIPPARNKTKRPHAVPLSASMVALIKAQPKDGEFVFPSSAGTAFTGFGKAKATLDAAILVAMREAAGKGEKVRPLPHWTLHDLRRTAKTLMQRAGVRPDISERVLGHVIKGVEGVYDRHGYAEEKREALEKLAGMVDRILNPPPSNVAKLGERRSVAAR